MTSSETGQDWARTILAECSDLPAPWASPARNTGQVLVRTPGRSVANDVTDLDHLGQEV
jgi:hypothetical protein